MRITAARDVLDRAGYKGKDEILLTQQFDIDRFSSLSDAELDTLLMLAREASRRRELQE